MIELKQKDNSEKTYNLFLNENLIENAEVSENLGVKDYFDVNARFFYIKIPFKDSGEEILEDLNFYKKTRADSLYRIKRLDIFNILDWLDPKYFSNYLSIYFITNADHSIRCLNCLEDISFEENFCWACGYQAPEDSIRTQLLQTHPHLFELNRQSLNIFPKELGKDFILEITFVIKPNSLDWNLPFSISHYKQKFTEIWELSLNLHSSFERIVILFKQDLEAVCRIKGIEKKFIEEINIVNEFLKICHIKTTESLLKETKTSVLIAFNFPDEIKSICEQYLWYFATFLRDLGINATSNLKEEAGTVLFSVTPTDDFEALDKIREALEIYLRLPSSPLISNSQEIAIQRLESQVEFFRSQIRLARAELQLKEATIQQQQITIIKLGENVMIDSMVKDITPKNAETQGEIFGGSVKLRTPKKLEDYGIEKIDLKKLWDYLKEKFKKPD